MSEQGLAIVPDKRGSDSLRADLRKGYIKLHPNAWDGRCVGDST